MNHPDSALIHIVEADLPPATERVALRLAARAEWTLSGHGYVSLSWQDYAALCKRTNHNSARRHLTALVKAGLIRYCSYGHGEPEGSLDIIWLTGPELSYVEGSIARGDWAGPNDAALAWNAPQPTQVAPTRAADSAGVRHARRASAPPSCPHAPESGPTPRAAHGAQRANSVCARAAHGAPPRYPSHTRALVGGGTTFSHPRGDPSTTTNHPPAISQQLRALGLRPDSVPMHRDLCADDVRRILGAWQQDAAAQEVGTGALLYRLRRGITPVDPSAIRHRESERSKYEIPEEYADIIIG